MIAAYISIFCELIIVLSCLSVAISHVKQGRWVLSVQTSEKKISAPVWFTRIESGYLESVFKVLPKDRSGKS